MHLFDFREPASIEAFSPIDDVVMGGVSSSSLTDSGHNTAFFSGDLSLDQGGGFALVRSREITGQCADAEALVIEHRGDGQRYKVSLKVKGSDSLTYQAGFDTERGLWHTVRLPFADFEATIRGREQPELGALVPSEITSVGLMIADRQAGPFRLELRKIFVT